MDFDSIVQILVIGGTIVYSIWKALTKNKDELVQAPSAPRPVHRDPVSSRQLEDTAKAKEFINIEQPIDYETEEFIENDEDEDFNNTSTIESERVNSQKKLIESIVQKRVQREEQIATSAHEMTNSKAYDIIDPQSQSNKSQEHLYNIIHSYTPEQLAIILPTIMDRYNGYNRKT